MFLLFHLLKANILQLLVHFIFSPCSLLFFYSQRKLHTHTETLQVGGQEASCLHERRTAFKLSSQCVNTRSSACTHVASVSLLFFFQGEISFYPGMHSEVTVEKLIEHTLWQRAPTCERSVSPPPSSSSKLTEQGEALLSAQVEGRMVAG